MFMFQLLSFMHAHSTYFHQGHDLFTEFEPEMKSITSQVRVTCEQITAGILGPYYNDIKTNRLRCYLEGLIYKYHIW